MPLWRYIGLFRQDSRISTRKLGSEFHTDIVRPYGWCTTYQRQILLPGEEHQSQREELRIHLKNRYSPPQCIIAALRTSVLCMSKSLYMWNKWIFKKWSMTFTGMMNQWPTIKLQSTILTQKHEHTHTQTHTRKNHKFSRKSYEIPCNVRNQLSFMRLQFHRDF